MINNGICHGAGGSTGRRVAGGRGFGAFIPIILMFVIFYFLLIRPQQKKAKQHQEMIANLKKGDRDHQRRHPRADHGVG
ncbi:MAG: preprotein translocase subunit YajC [Desulfobacterales bacterium]